MVEEDPNEEAYYEMGRPSNLVPVRPIDYIYLVSILHTTTGEVSCCVSGYPSVSSVGTRSEYSDVLPLSRS